MEYPTCAYSRLPSYLYLLLWPSCAPPPPLRNITNAETWTYRACQFLLQIIRRSTSALRLSHCCALRCPGDLQSKVLRSLAPRGPLHLADQMRSAIRRTWQLGVPCTSLALPGVIACQRIQTLLSPPHSEATSQRTLCCCMTMSCVDCI